MFSRLLLFIFSQQFVVIASTMTSSSLKYDEYVFPYWANIVGWAIAMSSMLFVPIYAIYKFLSVPGTFKEVSMKMFILTNSVFVLEIGCLFRLCTH